MVEFDPKFSEFLVSKSSELIAGARVTEASAPHAPPPRANPIHPIFTFTSGHMISDMKAVEKVITAGGIEAGRYWTVGGRRIGWEGESFKTHTTIASALGATGPLKGMVSTEFALDELFTWLRDTLESKCSESLPHYLSKRCDQEVRDIEVWIPLFQTYAEHPFRMGNVIFRTISKQLLDKWYERPQATLATGVTVERSRERSRLQATLAASTVVHAEPTKASQVALARAIDATALLRFLSEANLSCRIRSYVTPLGMQREDTVTELTVADEAIRQVSSRVLRPGTAAWNVDQAKSSVPGVMALLQNLASDSQSTELRRALFDALLIYSKNNLTVDPAERLVFVFSALESILLRDGNEPIQVNLADRLAFLIGETFDERRKIVEITKKTYSERSKFVHHGQGSKESDLLDEFLVFAWKALANILLNLSSFASRADLISFLNDRKLA
jgi:hypothetical protein